MKRKKILYLDVDNTLIFGDKNRGEALVPINGERNFISKRTISLLKKLKEHYLIVFVTGRRISSYNRLVRHVPSDYAILEHGSIIMHGNKVDSEWEERLRNVIGTIKNKHGILWDYKKELEKEGIEVISRLRYGSIRVNPATNHSFTRSELERILKGHPTELTVLRNEEFVDIIPSKANKNNAMRFLAKKLFLDWQNSYFVGNDYNDLDALNSVAHPFTHSGAVRKVIDLVNERKGYTSPYRSYSAINDILSRLSQNHYQE